jgi:hypothetical protein
MRLLAIGLVLLLASCAGQYSEDPRIAGIQKWTDTCRAYKQVLTGINDALEIQTITKDSAVVENFRPVKAALQPVCESDTPPMDQVGTGSFQKMLDEQLLELIKARKGLANG